MSMRTVGRLAAAVGLILAGLLSAACTGSELETRTFRLRSLGSSEAQELVRPYVYERREGAPGFLSVTDNAVTVRELPENLERIEAVLAEFDRERAPLRLRFHLIYADGDTETDPEIAEISEALRGVLRYQGYRLGGTSVLQVHGASSSRQQLTGPEGDIYYLDVQVRDVWGPADSMMVHLRVSLLAPFRGDDLMNTELSAQVGKTVVIGTAQTGGGDEAVILAVTPELATGG